MSRTCGDWTSLDPVFITINSFQPAHQLYKNPTVVVFEYSGIPLIAIELRDHKHRHTESNENEKP